MFLAFWRQQRVSLTHEHIGHTMCAFEENLALKEQLKRAREEARFLRLQVKRQGKELKRLLDELDREKLKTHRLLQKTQSPTDAH